MTVVSYLFPSVWRRIENLRGHRDRIPDDAPNAATIDARIRELVAQADEIGPEFGERYPALESWRVQVIGDAASRTALEVAAAYELTALVAESLGEMDGAAVALRRARLRLVGEVA